VADNGCTAEDSILVVSVATFRRPVGRSLVGLRVVVIPRVRPGVVCTVSILLLELLLVRLLFELLLRRRWSGLLRLQLRLLPRRLLNVLHILG
jgi:hypothetical protein